MNYSYLNMDTPEELTNEDIINIVYSFAFCRDWIEPLTDYGYIHIDLYNNGSPDYEHWSLVGTIIKGINLESVFNASNKQPIEKEDFPLIQPFSFPRDRGYKPTCSEMYNSIVKFLKTSYYSNRFSMLKKIMEGILVEIGKLSIEKYEGTSLLNYCIY